MIKKYEATSLAQMEYVANAQNRMTAGKNNLAKKKNAKKICKVLRVDIKVNLPCT